MPRPAPLLLLLSFFFFSLLFVFLHLFFFPPFLSSFLFSNILYILLVHCMHKFSSIGFSLVFHRLHGPYWEVMRMTRRHLSLPRDRGWGKVDGPRVGTKGTIQWKVSRSWRDRPAVWHRAPAQNCRPSVFFSEACLAPSGHRASKNKLHRLLSWSR